MAVTSGKSLILQPCGPAISISPANSDVSVHVDEKTARLAAFGFSTISRSSLNLNCCLFLGSAAASQCGSVLDVYADRYDRGQANKANAPNSLFPESSISLGQDDIVIPCFLNRRISKAELKQLSVTTLFPSVEDRGFSPSIRDIIACCISLRLSSTTDSPRTQVPAVVTRADLRISLPTNTVYFVPVMLPSQLFGGIAVSDLLPPVISSPGRQLIRAGYISLRAASNRLASSIGFLLDGDVWKQTNPGDASLLGIWIAGINGSPAEDLRVYAACMRYAFDTRLAKCRLLPSLLVNHRAPPTLPFTSTQSTPFFLVAIVNNSPRTNVSFYECRLSPALQPTFTILTATTLLPPRSVTGDRNQMLKLNFILGRAASVAVGVGDGRESLDDSIEDQPFGDEEPGSEPPSAIASFRRKPPQPQPQPNVSFPLPSVPDVSVWLPPTSDNQFREGVTPRQITALSTPRNSSEARPLPVSEIRLSDSKSSAVSSSDFEDEWRAMRQKVDLMWQNSAQPPKLSSTLMSQTTSASIEIASVITSPPQVLRGSSNATNNALPDGNISARSLRDACVGVGTSLLMLNSNADRKKCDRVNEGVPLVIPPPSNSCSQCCSREDLATRSSKVDVADAGCCLFPRRLEKQSTASEANCPLKETTKSRPSESFAVNEKSSQYDPCSLILKWLQRCGNEPAGSSTCGEAIGPDNHSRCSSNDDNVKTAAAICTYLNGDLALQKSRRNENGTEDEDDDDDHENQFVSLSASSNSMILKPQSRNEKPTVSSSSATESTNASSCWANGVHASMTSEKPAENSTSFAARAREIVRQMDEWGLAPPQIRSEETSLEISMPNDISRVAGYDQIKAALDASCSIDSVASRTSSNKNLIKANTSQRASADVNASVALPRVVALESLRLGPTNTTVVMKNLASKHLTSSVKDHSLGENCSSIQKPPKTANYGSRR